MILDTNRITTAKLDQLKALGYTQLIRYIATADKSITPAEARAIAAAGIQLVTVYEAWGDTKGELSAALGTLHAKEYLRKVGAIGQPEGSSMFYAVDTDVSTQGIRERIIPYFQAIKTQIAGKFRIGVYGSGNVCAALLDRDLCDLTWVVDNKWGGSQAFIASGRWNLKQHLPKIIAGLDCDPDDINPAHANIGAFVPFGGIPDVPTIPATPAHDAFWLQEQLKLTGNYAGKIDGVVGPLTTRAMISYVENVNAHTFTPS